MTSAKKAAELILCLSKERALGDVNLVKLQKLLYFAEGLMLAIRDEPLFAEEMEAWMLGPVCPSVYYEYQNADAISLGCPADFDEQSVGDEEKAIIKMALDLYGQYSPEELVEITHGQPPYREAKERNEHINKETMKKFFSEQVFPQMSLEEEDELCEYLGRRAAALWQ